MALIDPETIGQAIAPLEEGRATGAGALRLADAQLLRPDVSVAEATDVLWIRTSFDTFDLLRAGRHHAVDKSPYNSRRSRNERTLCQPAKSS